MVGPSLYHGHIPAQYPHGLLAETMLEKLKQRLLKVIDPQKDSLRFYRLPGDRERWVEVYGLDHYVDYDASLVI